MPVRLCACLALVLAGCQPGPSVGLTDRQVSPPQTAQALSARIHALAALQARWDHLAASHLLLPHQPVPESLLSGLRPLGTEGLVQVASARQWLDQVQAAGTAPIQAGPLKGALTELGTEYAVLIAATDRGDLAAMTTARHRAAEALVRLRAAAPQINGAA